ncbi:MAG: hypothetical protein AAGD05_04180 [Bacteroidota bacterium]
MAFSKFFKTPGHKRFEYTPRHWDPQKEDLEKRLENAKKNNGSDPESVKARISNNMRRGSYRHRGAGAARNSWRPNLLFLGIVIVLVAITYLLLLQYLPYFLDSMGLEPPANNS